MSPKKAAHETIPTSRGRAISHGTEADRETMRIVAMLLSSVAIMASPLACDPPDIETNDGEEVREAPQAITTCAANMFTETGTSLPGSPSTSLSMTLGSGRGPWFGVNHMSGAGVDLEDPTKTSGLTPNLRARRFPGGLGGWSNWKDYSADLGAFIAKGALPTEKVSRLFLVVNVNGVYRVDQGGTVNPNVVPGDIDALPHCQDNNLYSFEGCLADMATHVGLFAAEVRALVQANYAGNPPEVIFEIGNEIPLLIAHAGNNQASLTGHFTLPTASNYAEIVAAYAAKITDPTIGRADYKIAAAGQGPEHGDNSIWKALHTRGVSYDYRVVHDYGWVPAMNGANNYGTDHQTTISNNALQSLHNYDGNTDLDPDATGARPVVITEFGSPDTFTNGTGGVPATPTSGEIPGAPRYTQAILNEAIQASTYANLGVSTVAAALKWPAKAADPTQEFRAWEPNACAPPGCTDAANTLPNYVLYKIMGPFLSAATKGKPGQWSSSDTNVLVAQAASATTRYAVFTNVGATSYTIRVTMPANAVVTLEGLRGYATTARPTHVGGGSASSAGGCSKSVNAQGVLAFGLAPYSMAVVTY